MYLFKRTADLIDFVQAKKRAGLRIGFTPTMGALHQGHTSLIQQSVQETDITVCSIFINPTQFNEETDFELYPYTPANDIELLAQEQTSVLYMPTKEEIYPPDFDFDFTLDFGHLDQVLEGQFRPGHFKGVAQVVKRLLEIVQPDLLYMGQKDFQQVAIIRHLIQVLGLPVQLQMCPIIRDTDGLALSSRNTRLDPKFRALAPVIYKTLMRAKEQWGKGEAKSLTAWGSEQLEEGGLKPEYFEIIDGYTLLPALPETNFVVACVAAWAGDVRLIDNMVLKLSPQKEVLRQS